jgi:hypothetical protein
MRGEYGYDNDHKWQFEMTTYSVVHAKEALLSLLYEDPEVFGVRTRFLSAPQ